MKKDPDQHSGPQTQTDQSSVVEANQVTIVAGTENHSRLVKFSLFGIFLILLMHSLYIASAVLIPITLSLMLSLLLAPIVRKLSSSLHISPPLGALITVLAVAGLISGIIYSLAEPTSEWMKEAPTALYKLRTKVDTIRNPIEDIEKAAESLNTLTEGKTKPNVQKVEINKISFTDSILNAAPSTLSGIGITLVLTYFLLASGNSFLRRLVQQLDSLTRKKLLIDTINTIQLQLSKYLYKISIINISLGAAGSILMYSLGVPNYLLWGVVAAVLNFAPYVGPLATIAIYAFVGVVTFDDLDKALIAPSVFLLLTALEGQFITPMVVGRDLKVSPVAIILVIIIFGSLWGLVGVLLSVPLLVCAKIILERTPGFEPIARLIDTNSKTG